MSILKIKLLSENAKQPTLGTPGSAGHDLYSPCESVVPARGKKLIMLDISMAIPDGYYGQIHPRSGTAVRNSIETGAGVIDSDYRNNCGVLLYNHGDEDFKVSKGDRIAQLILHKILVPQIQLVDDLDETQRGTGGFGSTGR